VPLPPGYPVDLEREARIRSGVVVHVRPIRREDAAALVDFHTALSAQSVYLRFFSFHPVLSPKEVARFTNVDYLDRLALVVELDGRLLGVGRFERLGATDEAEVAFVVADAHQSEGIGTLLADGLARAAWERGIVTFAAETLAENSEMLEVFRGLGFPVTSAFDGGVVRVRFPIEPTGAYLDALARREAGRAVGRAAPRGARARGGGLPT
jgi:GNAT superfamily N-acetyltransferase